MAIYKTCPYCGANLDPGEKCDCFEAKKENLIDQIILLTEEQADFVWKTFMLSEKTGKPIEECARIVKRATASTVNADDGKTEQDLRAPVSASIVNENND